MNVFLPSSISFSGYKCFNKEENNIPWFQPFNIIIGRNNSGKTSFIDVVHALCDPEFRASNMENIEISLKYKIENYKYFDIDNLDLQTYRNKSLTLHFFGTYFADTELKVDVNLTKYNSAYHNSYTIVSDTKCVTANGSTILLKLNDETTLDPFHNSVFRYISSERDITPESFFSEADTIDIKPNGIGTTKYVCSVLNNKNKKDAIIQDDILEALNEILSSDGHYRNIKVKQDNGDNWEIYFEDDNRNQYPLSKLGSGLKTILLVLLNLIAIPHDYENKNMVYAFEELENNLHPSLEKRLYSYIYKYAQEHNFTIFLTTHSSVAIDLFSREKTVYLYKTEQTNNGTRICPIEGFDDSIEIIDELGIKASDLLQANGIIWVEGPSDRIYIKNWLEMLYPETFVEGRDYQFVYYGGRLLAHYTACDPKNNTEVENYINVLAVNTKAYFIMDSDKSSSHSHLAKRKHHIKNKLEEKHIQYWITKGREIENYLDLSNEGIPLGQFDKLEDRLPSFDKVKFAKEHYQNVAFEKYDLKNSINKLATEIKRWNDKR